MRVTSGDFIYGLELVRDRYCAEHPEFLNKRLLYIDFLSLIDEDLQGMRDEYKRYRQQWSLDSLYEIHFSHFMTTHPKYHQVLQEANIDDDDSNQYLRRKCKGGLLWIMGMGRRVHFVLDDIDIEAVIKKVPSAEEIELIFPDGSIPIRYRGITGSELRFCYRNWHILQEYVVFWCNDLVVSAPWLGGQYQERWDEYQQARENKIYYV